MGLFIDYPSIVTFDIAFTDKDVMTIEVDEADYDLYIIEGKSPLEIIGEFRKIIGESYIAPKWAFGYIQSRWGYINEEDVREVVSGHRDNQDVYKRQGSISPYVPFFLLYTTLTSSVSELENT